MCRSQNSLSIETPIYKTLIINMAKRLLNIEYLKKLLKKTWMMLKNTGLVISIQQILEKVIISERELIHINIEKRFRNK